LVQTDPYPMVEVEPLQPQEESDEAQIGILKAEICALLRSEEALTNEVPEEFVGFLRELDEPGTFIDLTAFAVCRCPRVKQSILEALEVPDRFRLFARYLERERDRIRLHRKLQGPLSDDSISLN
ncbi:MAG: LON peptidase substrate-binding domain-containing protein, partial [Opitutales bacterium]